jgi:hypothetical protein
MKESVDAIATVGAQTSDGERKEVVSGGQH